MVYRVLIVDDSSFMRSLITKILEADSNFQVVGTAVDGAQAVQMVKRYNPDVVTMDVEMPVKSGLQALQEIIEEHPVPVVMLSSLTPAGAQQTIAALELGAVDFIHKPSGSISIDIFKIQDEIREKVKAAAQIRVVKSSPVIGRSLGKSRPIKSAVQQLVAIGTSTGGPQALTRILTELPANYSYPIVIVQHMPPQFTKSLAKRLNEISALRVVEAEQGIQVCNGTVYIAPGDYHMNVVESGGSYCISLHQRASPGRHRPSVNELFYSVAELKKLKCHYILLTGMGSDGAEAMAHAKNNGAVTTIAQDKESCVVFGMPRAAIERNAAGQIMPLEQIAGALVKLARTN